MDSECIEAPSQNYSEDFFSAQYSIDESIDPLVNKELPIIDEPDFEENEHEDPEESNMKNGAVEKTQAPHTEVKLVQLPLSRIKNIIKLDPDISLVSSEALFAITKATELFIESLAKESYIHTSQAKKKTVQKRDIDLAIMSVDSLVFLDGALNF